MFARPILFTSMLLALAAPASAQTWRAPERAGAKLGVQAIACQGEFCMAVACRGGAAELVSMSPGGGPFEGAVETQIGAARETATFVEDPAIMDAFGVLGTRAKVSGELLAALAGAKTIRLSGATISERVSKRFSLKGYAAFAPRIFKACGFEE